MESEYQDLKSHLRNGLSHFRWKLLGFNLINGIIILLFSFLIFLFFYGLAISFLQFSPLFKSILYIFFLLILGVESFFYFFIPIFKFLFSLKISNDLLFKQLLKIFPQNNDIFISVYNFAFHNDHIVGDEVLKKAAFIQKYNRLILSNSYLNFPKRLFIKRIPVLVILLSVLLLIGQRWNHLYFDLKDDQKVSGPSNEILFHIKNKSLEVEYGKSYQLQLEILGDKELMNNVFVCYGGGEFLMTREDSIYLYDFELVNNDLQFYFKFQDYESDHYLLKVLPTPLITNYKVTVIPPRYTGLKAEVLANTVDFNVLYGSTLNFEIDYSNLDSMFLENGEQKTFIPLKHTSKSDFSKFIKNSGEYRIVGSNVFFPRRNLLTFNVICSSDLYPSIQVTEIQDSLQNSVHYFYGIITDDYGFSDLYFNYSLGNDPVVIMPVSILKNINSQEFYFSFNFAEFAGIDKTRINYYFEVFDNDNISGPKSTRSSEKIYQIPDLNTIFDYNVEVGTSVNHDLENAERLSGEIVSDIKELRKKLLDNTVDDWEKQQLSKSIVKKKKTLDELLQNVKEDNLKKADLNKHFTAQDSLLIDKQKKIQNLLDNIMDNEMKQLLDEFSKLSEEFSKDKFKKLDDKMELTFDQMSQELDRNIELLKRFQIEERHDLISKQLEKLSKDQKQFNEILKNKSISNDSILSQSKQLTKDLSKIKMNYNNLLKDNAVLTEPYQLQEFKTFFDQLSKDFEQQRKNSLENKKDKSLSEKIDKELSKLSENIKQQQNENFVNKSLPQNDIELIIQNILIISLSQEELLEQFSDVQAQSLKYNELGRIQDLKRQEYRIVKDSLSLLAKSNLMLASLLSHKFYDIEVKFGLLPGYIQDNKRSELLKEQQYIINYLNDIALSLTDALQKDKQNANQSNKKEGKKNSDKKGDGNSSGDGKNSYPKMKQIQNNLKKQLEDLVSQMKKGEKGKPLQQRISNMIRENELFRKSLNQYISETGSMSNIEKQLLNEINQLIDQNIKDMANYSVSNQLINRNNLIYNKLLMSEKAAKEKEEFEEKRKSETALQTHFNRPKDVFEFQKKSAYIKTDIQKSDLKLNSYFKTMYNHYYIKLGNE